MGFLACDCGFYGLTYSAGKLCQDPYLSTMLLCGADIFGYLLALGADKYGRNNTQTCAFLLAGICLFYCSTGEEGSFFVLTAAVVGRLCLDVCFTTVYLGLAEIFSGSKVALATCETAARFGAIIAPFQWNITSKHLLFYFCHCLLGSCWLYNDIAREGCKKQCNGDCFNEH